MLTKKLFIWNITPHYYTFATEEEMKGTIAVPFFFIPMAEDTLKKIENWLLEILADYPDLFLVEAKIKPTNNIKVFIDGDNGFPIDLCVRVNRKLYKFIEEAAIYPEGDFGLEVSSPGITEPLKLQRQYAKNVGREVEITFKDGTTKEGTLEALAEEDIVLAYSEGKGKKAVQQKLVIPMSNIKTTIVQIKF